MITISRSVTIADNEVSLSGIRAQGAGGQQGGQFGYVVGDDARGQQFVEPGFCHG